MGLCWEVTDHLKPPLTSLLESFNGTGLFAIVRLNCLIISVLRMRLLGFEILERAGNYVQSVDRIHRRDDAGIDRDYSLLAMGRRLD